MCTPSSEAWRLLQHGATVEGALAEATIYIYPREVRWLVLRRGIAKLSPSARIQVDLLPYLEVGSTRRLTLPFHRSRGRERATIAVGAFLRIRFPEAIAGPVAGLCLPLRAGVVRRHGHRDRRDATSSSIPHQRSVRGSRRFFLPQPLPAPRSPISFATFSLMATRKPLRRSRPPHRSAGAQWVVRRAVALGAKEATKAVGRRAGAEGLKRFAGSNPGTAVAVGLTEQIFNTVQVLRGKIDGQEYGVRTVRTAGSTGGAIGGAAAGAAVGSVIPGVGTVVGAVIGGLAGSLGGGGLGRELGKLWFGD